MAEIKLFSLNEGVKECTSSEVVLEKELQTLIEQNMEIFFGVRFLKSEYVVTNGRMDSIGIDENNSPVIFEYKRSQNENVINQGLFYLDWLLDHKADFKLLVIDKLGKEAADNIDWSVPCVICVAHDFTKYDMHAVNQMQRNIKLVSYRRYDNGMLLLEHLNTPIVKPIMENVGDENGTKNSTQKNHMEKLAAISENMKNLYHSICDFIESLGDDIVSNQLKLYVIFNSTLYDEYYRILNGSTQVNSTEINAMPVPDLESIQEMGRTLMKSKDMSESNCNMILEGYCG